MTDKNSQIYSMGYERWEGDRKPHQPAWWLIAQAGTNNLVRSAGCFSRWTVIIFFVIYYFQILFVSVVRFQWANLKNYDLIKDLVGGFDPPDFSLTEVWHHKFFILVPSLVFCTLVMVVFGSQLISKDKRANALQVYFSKAVSRFDYVFGKFLAVGIMTATTTLIPSALILVAGTILSTDHLSFFKESWYIPFITSGYWLMLTAVFGSITLFFSASFNKAYLAAVAIIGFQFFALVFANLLEFILGSRGILEGLNWTGSLFHLGKALFDWQVPAWDLAIWRGLDLLVLSALLTVFIFRKVRPVEVVK